MSERFDGESHFETSRRERDPDVETKEHLDEINRLLARLIEKAGDLPSDVKQAIRAKIQDHLTALGLKNLEECIAFNTAFYQKFYDKLSNVPTPEDYPSKDLFRQRFEELHQVHSQEVAFPLVPEIPFATQVADHAQGDWSELRGRMGKNVVDYLYDLGKLMSSELIYPAVFDERTDVIMIGKGWRVESGRHRAYTLKILGSEYVEQKGMNRWVGVRRES